MNSFPLICALFITNIGTILGFFSTIAGYMVIYVMPIFVHLKH